MKDIFPYLNLMALTESMEYWLIVLSFETAQKTLLLESKAKALDSECPKLKLCTPTHFLNLMALIHQMPAFKLA